MNIAVVGCGYWGPKWLRNLNSLDSVNLVAACDICEEQLDKHVKNIHPKLSCFNSFRVMLEQIELDAVIIATPIATHYELCREALLAGKHVFVEKPMTSDSVQCRELIELAKKQKLKLMVGHTFVFAPAVRTALQIIRSGEIGELQEIACERLNYGIFQNDLNVVWDLAPHDLSIILEAYGELPNSVNCIGVDLNEGNPGVEDVAAISLSFGRGRVATIEASWMEPKKIRRIKFVGTKKVMVFDDVEPIEKIRLYGLGSHETDYVSPKISLAEPLFVACDNFVNWVNGSAPPFSDTESGFNVVRVIEAAQKSMALNHGASDFPVSDFSDGRVNLVLDEDLLEAI